MIQVQVKVNKGRVYQSIKRLTDEAIPNIVNADIEAAMLTAQREASANYPRGSYSGYSVPYHRNRKGQLSKYIRTGQYGRGFRLIKTGYRTKRAYTLTTRVRYGVYVGGNASGYGQADIHRGRWPLIYLAVKRAAEKLTDQSSIKIRKAIRNEGLGI
jgi:hypothetical protein